MAAETKQGFDLDDSIIGVKQSDSKMNTALVDDEIFGNNVQINNFDDELL